MVYNICMTKQDIDDLCTELKEVMVTKISPNNMSEAQMIFWVAFEDASFDADLLTAYSNMVEFTPDISLRNLHSFLLGHAFGTRYGKTVGVTDDGQTH